MARPHPCPDAVNPLLTFRFAFASLCCLLGGLPAARAQTGALPTELVCDINASVSAWLNLDASGKPFVAGVYTSAGTRECDLLSQQPAQTQGEEGWRFEWSDSTASRHRIDVRRSDKGTPRERYVLSLAPASCGALALPARMELARADTRCHSKVSREGAFVLFWRQLRQAVLERDAQRLQALAVAQPAFAEGPDSPKAPASLLAQGVRCMASLPGPQGRALEQVLRSVETPLDGLHFRTESDTRRSIGDGLGMKWTSAGWRIDFLGGERAIFKQGC